MLIEGVSFGIARMRSMMIPPTTKCCESLSFTDGFLELDSSMQLTQPLFASLTLFIVGIMHENECYCCANKLRWNVTLSKSISYPLYNHFSFKPDCIFLLYWREVVESILCARSQSRLYQFFRLTSILNTISMLPSLSSTLLCGDPGSACVYSKKVEYLYQLVYETLDMLASKK